MLPSRYRVVDALPLLASGKVDRKGLSFGTSGRSIADQGYVGPQTETQEKLIEIWREVLGTEPIGIEDNFFELGGHSLVVIQVVARIRKVFGVEVPVVSLFEGPTIAGLAVDVEEAKAKGIKPRMPILSREATPASDREALLARLDKLPEEELRELLKRALQDKRAADPS